MHFNPRTLLAAATMITLAGCGGGGADVQEPSGAAPAALAFKSGASNPVAASLPDSITLMGLCEHPRSGTRPDGSPLIDRQGTRADEMKWVHAFIDESYLWYKEVPAGLNPSSFNTPVAYFNALKTPALTASGRPKDRFHFTYPSAVWDALSSTGASTGYGLTLVRYTDPSRPRVWKLTMVEPDSPAAQAGLQRGDQLLSVDGVPVAFYPNSARAAALINAGLFPAAVGEKHRFMLSSAGQFKIVTLTAQTVGGQSVQNVKVLDTSTGKVGYLQFNEHNGVAESQLAKAFSDLQSAGVADLVLDMRYNGGGLLTIASQLAYMVAGPQATKGKVFERVVNNGKSTPPAPMPFRDTAIGFPAAAPLKAGTALPYLGLKRVTVLTTAGTCSASESVINSLRGVGVEVNLIGGDTCGKPYAFVPAPNCGTTYFAIETQGVNDRGEGDYADGFQPTCRVDDDLDHALGDPQEGLLAAALSYLERGSCAVPGASRQVAGAAMQMVRPPIREISVDDRAR